MDLTIRNYLARSENEIVLAASIKKLSDDPDAKKFFQIDGSLTFYSSVIAHSYYSIFYAAKAILLAKGIETGSPDAHKKTLDAFKEHLVDSGFLDVKLFEIYKKMVVRAEALLGIFKAEKKERGDFTYNTIPQANQEPAEDSLRNAKTFVANITKIIGALK
ncbi:HEPN domain-containing protein [Candidatus Woesearchaeota archaeon]|nr:HEPN domain-containing protein [Candidatus Woesearchaeota archaeon]